MWLAEAVAVAAAVVGRFSLSEGDTIAEGPVFPTYYSTQ